MPDDLVPQIPVIRRVFEGFRVPVLIEPGMEADDVIATLARRGEERGLDVFICTADKDARQLLDDHIRILNLRKNKVHRRRRPRRPTGASGPTRSSTSWP